jgi:hypothetical protein
VGPVDLCALAWLAAICACVAMSMLLKKKRPALLRAGVVTGYRLSASICITRMKEKGSGYWGSS